MFRSRRLTRQWIAVVAVYLCLALGARAQDPQAVPRGIFAMDFELGKDPNAPLLEIRLKGVLRGGPADLAGLRPGDVILELNNQPVTQENWWDVMRDIPPGTAVKVTYVRGGQTASATVTVGDRVEVYTRLATAGDREAAVRTAELHWSGQGVPKNKEEALRWYRRAAEQGFVTAQFNLARMHEEGRGTSADIIEAAYWYRQAAEKGHAPAQYAWGHLHELGRGALSACGFCIFIFSRA